MATESGNCAKIRQVSWHSKLQLILYRSPYDCDVINKASEKKRLKKVNRIVTEIARKSARSVQWAKVLCKY